MTPYRIPEDSTDFFMRNTTIADANEALEAAGVTHEMLAEAAERCGVCSARAEGRLSFGLAPHSHLRFDSGPDGKLRASIQLR